MTTDQALDKMELLLPYYAKIFNDPDAAEIIKTVREEKGESLVGDTLQKLLPIFTGKHREALYHIISIVHDKPVEDVKAQPIMETIAALRNALVNETLLFFMACMRLVKNV